MNYFVEMKRLGQTPDSVYAPAALSATGAYTIPQDCHYAFVSSSTAATAVNLPTVDSRPTAVKVYATDITQAMIVYGRTTALYTFTAANTMAEFVWTGSAWYICKSPN